VTYKSWPGAGDSTGYAYDGAGRLPRPRPVQSRDQGSSSDSDRFEVEVRQNSWDCHQIIEPLLTPPSTPLINEIRTLNAGTCLDGQMAGIL
jgi:hypothetical protein